jgi:hypothetical protein
VQQRLKRFAMASHRLVLHRRMARGNSASQRFPPACKSGAEGTRQQSNNSESLYGADDGGMRLITQRVDADSLNIFGLQSPCAWAGRPRQPARGGFVAMGRTDRLIE